MLKVLLFSATAMGVLGITSTVLTWFMLISAGYMYVVLFASLFKRKKVDKSYDPTVTILIPAHNEEHVIDQTVRAMMAQSYKDLEVIIIDDASIDQTPHILIRLREEFPNLRVLRRELYMTRGKPAALNDALKLAQGSVIAVFDADTFIEPDYVARVVPHLLGRRVAGVQTKVTMSNKDENSWTTVQDSEFAIYCSVIQAGRDRIHGYCGLGGSGQFVKRFALDRVGGWQEGMLAEDFDLTLTLMKVGYRVKYVDIPVYQEAVSTPRALFRQRNRWSQGGVQSTLRHFKTVMTSRQIGILSKLDTLIVFSMLIQPFIILTSLGMTAYDFIKRRRWVWHLNLNHPLTLWLLSSYVLFIVLGHLVGKPSEWKKLWKHLFLYYLYSMMWSVMYMSSIVEFIRKRGNVAWAKTVHKGSDISG